MANVQSRESVQSNWKNLDNYRIFPENQHSDPWDYLNKDKEQQPEKNSSADMTQKKIEDWTRQRIIDSFD